MLGNIRDCGRVEPRSSVHVRVRSNVPIYEYVCESCQHRFEIKQGFNDPPLSTCERCNGAVNKVISAPAIMFKGTGWYVTDYSDKLKPPGDTKAAEKPAGEHKDKKEPAAAGASTPPSSDSGASSTSTSKSDGNGGSSSSDSSSSTTSPKSSSSS